MIHVATAVTNSALSCGENNMTEDVVSTTVVVVVVLPVMVVVVPVVVVVVVVVEHIDPSELWNMLSLRALESTHAPQSVCLNAVAP